MAAKFGTSGLRGLVTELSDDVVADYTRAFLASCKTGSGLWIGLDLRESSERIAHAVTQAAALAGTPVVVAGVVPTPALALAAQTAGAAAIMVTGSHIPADRNGLKFYVPDGEIGKSDEAAINQALGAASEEKPSAAIVRYDDGVGQAFHSRYVSAFGSEALKGLRVGVYSHSAAGRDLLLAVMADLGAEVTELARSGSFIPVDTEAVDPATRQMLTEWSRHYALDAIVSTDGDSDRPMLTDAAGNVVPGDVLGQITAAFLGADTVITPISSNTALELSGRFARVLRTRIGSPFVIAAMEQALRDDPTAQVVGYEANGGFLLGYTAKGPSGPLAPLQTRDSFLPVVAVLAAAAQVRNGDRVAALVAQQPERFTASDRLQDMPEAQMRAYVDQLANDAGARSAFLAACGAQGQSVDLTDGVRMAATDGRILHVRPSGNAPELRLYVEADEAATAIETLASGLRRLRADLGVH